MIKLMFATCATIAILCIAAAFYLLVHDKEGWGWFLVVAVLTFGAFSYNSGDTEEENEEKED